MSSIRSIISRQIFDSRGNPTIETDIFLKNGVYVELQFRQGHLLEKNGT